MRTVYAFFCAVLLSSAFSPFGQAAIVGHVTQSITGTNTVSSEASDFVVYDSTYSTGSDTVRKAGGSSLISAVSSDGSIGNNGNVGSLFSLQWIEGSPTESGTSSAYQYVGFGSGFSPRATYAEVTLTMPSSSGIFTLWLLGQPNSGTTAFDVTFGKSGDQFTDSYSTGAEATVFEFEFDLSGFNLNDTLTFRVDNVSGTNPWHNVGFYGAEFMIPEPSGASLVSVVTLAAFWIRRRFFD